MSDDPRQHVEDFDAPWSKALLKSPDYICRSGWAKRQFPRDKDNSSTRNAFFTETMATPTGLRACLLFRPRDFLPEKAECLLMLSIGAGGTDGHNHVMHGGMVYSILDEVQGMVCVELNVGAIMTGTMTVRYKKYVPTPCLLLAKSRVVRMQGRKIWTVASLEDGQGLVHAECDGLFIKLKTNL